MPTDTDFQQVDKSNPSRLLESLKSVAKATSAGIHQNPELFTAPIGAGVGAIIGGKMADDSVKGALAGAAGGGGLAYALTQILKNPSPAVPSEEFRERPDSSILAYPLDHPVKTLAVTTPVAGYGAYKIRKHVPGMNQNLLSTLLKFAKGDPEVWEPALRRLPDFLKAFK
jgi:hypothetical protein